MEGRDVTVNGVALPLTPLLLDGKPQEVIDSLKGMPPRERSAEPEVIAEGVASWPAWHGG
jgi:3-oxoacyl-[acyl-carrier protein] reductase